jgi:phosphoribosylformylglycinamidine cyclo-ligase
MVGAVERKRLVTGKKVRSGHVLIGLPSNGLHTNGYSLARKVLFEQAGLGVDDPFPGGKRSVADLLLAVHKSYLKPVRRLLGSVEVSGMAHITGGGLVDNVPRMLPDGLSAVIDPSTWRIPRLFRFIQEAGGIERDEMYRVFNMGIGYVMAVRRADVVRAVEVLRRTGARPLVIGYVKEGNGPVRLVAPLPG